MNAVIYARYSSDNQREESIEGQLRECKEFAEANDMIIVDTYIDRALSAKTDNRPEFQKMVKDSAKGAFELVIVWKLDRFARNRYDSAHYKAVLQKNGVKVVSATEKISQTPEGILLESLLEGMAEYYSAELAEKVTRGLTENALKCKYNGGTLPIGYAIDENQFFIIDPLTAPAVLDAFKHYAEGATMQQITDELNLRGVRTKKNTRITLNTQCLTGIPIDQDITDRELALNWGECRSGSWAGLCREVRQMNLTARKLLEGLISFKEAVLDGVLQGRLFTVNYPLLIEHITRKAKLYRRFVETLDREGDIPMCTMKEVECFWNRIMMEHAQFIRGLLDPCEAELMNTADDFAQKYCRLLEASRGAQDQTLTQQTLEETVKFRDFKAAGTQGIQQCRIRSIILPLLADHVLREANHYIRLLQH